VSRNEIPAFLHYFRRVYTLKALAIRGYAPSLSLIVRTTESGHKEVEQILQELGWEQMNP